VHIICKKCSQKVSPAKLVGVLVAKGVQYVGTYAVVYYLSWSTLSDVSIEVLVGAADTFQVACSFCAKHEGWITVYEKNNEALSLEKEVER